MHTLAKQRRIFILISLAVPVLLLVGFVVFPAVDLFRMSFTDWDGLSPTSNFIWFENYIDMFHNPRPVAEPAQQRRLFLCPPSDDPGGAGLRRPAQLQTAGAPNFTRPWSLCPYIINGVGHFLCLLLFLLPHQRRVLTPSWKRSSWGC